MKKSPTIKALTTSVTTTTEKKPRRSNRDLANLPTDPAQMDFFRNGDTLSVRVEEGKKVEIVAVPRQGSEESKIDLLVNELASLRSQINAQPQLTQEDLVAQVDLNPETLARLLVRAQRSLPQRSMNEAVMLASRSGLSLEKLSRSLHSATYPLINYAQKRSAFSEARPAHC